MTAAEEWLKNEMERLVREARGYGLSVSLHYEETTEQGGIYTLRIDTQSWRNGEPTAAPAEGREG